MKKNYLVLIFLFAAGLFSGSAQTITSQKGLTTAIFNLPAGTIKVYLPDDIRPGDIISGRIMTEPIGKNDKQLAKNLAELKKYSVSFNGENFPINNTNNLFRPVISTSKPVSGRLQLMMDIKTVEGEVVEVRIPNISPAAVPAVCAIPAHALSASPLRITGPFDGNASNTSCSLDNKTLDILAESPRQCIVSFPADASGTQSLNVQETGGQVCKKNVSAVNMDVTSGKLNLLKGEKTYINVEVTGLQNLPDTAKLTLENITTDVVLMQPSNNFLVLLEPDSVSGGIYNRSFDIQSIKSGTFTVNVNLDLPEPPPIYADNNGADVGGIKLHPLKVDGLKNGMSDVFKKAVIEITGNSATKYPELDGCGSCLTCIQSMLDKGKVALVGEIGKILMEHYVDLLVSGTGGALAWIKDKYDKLEKAGDIADAIAGAVAKGELQVVEFPEELCGYCLVSAIGFYDTKTGCMDAFFYCKGSKMCCTHSLTIIHLKYCVNEDGFKKPDSGLTIDVISK